MTKEINSTNPSVEVLSKDEGNKPIEIENGMCEIPEGIKAIGREYFKDKTELNEIELPNTLVSIEDYSFYNTGIRRVVIPHEVW